MLRSILFIVILFAMSYARAEGWPSAEPGEYTTKKDFTIAWAKRLRGFHTLTDLQRAAGSNGTISERSLEGNAPYIAFHWRSEPPNKNDVGYMLATVYRNGDIGVSIITTDNEEITINNKGAFICDKCNPPIDIEPPGSMVSH